MDACWLRVYNNVYQQLSEDRQLINGFRVHTFFLENGETIKVMTEKHLVRVAAAYAIANKKDLADKNWVLVFDETAKDFILYSSALRGFVTVFETFNNEEMHDFMATKDELRTRANVPFHMDYYCESEREYKDALERCGFYV